MHFLFAFPSVLRHFEARMSWAVLASFSRSPRSRPTTLFLLGCTLGFSLSLSITGLALYARDGWKRRLRKEREKQIVEIR